MSSIEAALAAIESLQPGEQFSYRKLQQSIAVTVQRSREGIKAFHPHAQSARKTSKLFTHSKSRSFYAISSALQGKVYLLHGL
ncbi:hypothetical protein L13192_12375 [Pyrenophora tritici-repentis]|nr:hypothetical protein L13192_12375 [Pyrenophora tritici-repentis]